MSEMLRRMMMLILCILMPTVGAGAEGEGTTGNQEQLGDAIQIEEQVKKLDAAGKFAEAVPLAERRLQILESVLGKNHPDVATSLNEVAGLYMNGDDYQKAEPFLLRALHIRESALGKNHPDVAQSLNNISYLYISQGIYRKAEKPLLRSLQIRNSVFGSNSLHTAISMNNLGMLYSYQGDYKKAEQFLVGALEIRETALDKNYPDIALSLNNLAFLYEAEGAYQKAELLHLRALQIRENIFGDKNPIVAESLNNIAALYRGQGFYDKAESFLLRALRISESSTGKAHHIIAIYMNSLASVYQFQGSYDKSELYYQRALKISETSFGINHPNVAQSLLSLASLYRDQKIYEKAKPLFVRALQIFESNLGMNHPLVATTLNNLAILYQAQGNSQQSFPLFLRAFLIYEHTLGIVRLLSTESRLDSFLQKLQSDVDTIYSLPNDVPHDISIRRLALTTTLLRKGRSLEEVTFASQEFFELQNQISGTEQESDFKQLQSLRRRLAKMYIQGPDKGNPQLKVKSLEEQLEDLEQRLARRYLVLRERRQTPEPEDVVAHVSETLPKDGALVEVVQYRPYQFRGTGKMPRWGEPRYLALVLSPEEVITAHDLGPAAPIDKAVIAWLPQLEDTHSQPRDYLPAAQALYQKIFAPLIPALQDRKQVFLSLDGRLQQVPFAALHDSTSFLLDRYHFTYLSSGRDLLRPAAKSTRPPSMVVIANPDFAHGRRRSTPAPVATAPLVAQAVARGDRQASLAEMLKGLEELPGTQAEADSLKRRFPWAKVLVRQAATKSALLGQQAPSILHMATHGLVALDDSAEKSPNQPPAHAGFKIVPPAQPPPPEKEPEVNPLRDLSRSALILAGAKAHKEQDRPDADDGVATALEVAGMNLRGTQLVVLSACYTGQGKVTRGQGLYGFRRAFFLAGAETLVTSLWKVDDQATAELMDSYYEKLQKGEGRVVAMDEAMKAMRAKRAHPAYWAPFIVLGRGDPIRRLGSAHRR